MPGPSQISCPFFPYGVFLDRFFSGHTGTLTCNLVPRALFSGFGGGKLGKSALGTRLAYMYGQH